MGSQVAPLEAVAPDTRELLVSLAHELHQAGAAAHRLEDATLAAARALDVELTVFSTPTMLMLAFEPERTHLLRVAPRDVDLDHLDAIDRLVGRLADRTLSPAQASAELASLAHRPSPWPRGLVWVALAGVSASVAVAFGGALLEAAAAATISVAAGLFEELVGARPQTRRALYLVTAFAAGLFAASLGPSGTLSTSIVVLAGLIALFPGFTLTTAVAELSTGNLVAGTSRLMAAALILMQLAVGAALAQQLGESWFGPSVEVNRLPPPLLVHAAATLVAALGLSVQLKVPRSMVPVAMVASLLSFGGTRLGANLLGAELGVMLGAFLATAGSNLYARVAGRPAVVPLTPAIVLLVPGSLGYRSMVALVEKQTVVGLETAVSVLLIAVCIVAGMILGGAAISPRRAL